MAERRLLLEGLAPGIRAGAGRLADPWCAEPGWDDHPRLRFRFLAAWRYPPPDRLAPVGPRRAGRRSISPRLAEQSGVWATAGRPRSFSVVHRTDELERGRVLVLAPHPDERPSPAAALLTLSPRPGLGFVIVASDGSRGSTAPAAALAGGVQGSLAPATARRSGLAPVQVAWWASKTARCPRVRPARRAAR